MKKSTPLGSLVISSTIALFTFTNAFAQKNNGSENIRLNQIGFYPGATKLAVVINSE